MSDLKIKKFPRFSRRYRAATIDGVIILFSSIVLLQILAPWDTSWAFKASIGLLWVIILEPVLVTIRGASIGHSIMGLKIVSQLNGENLNFGKSLFRFLTKLVLGTLSLLAILTTKKRQAIHDKMVGSVVIFRYPEKYSSNDLLIEYQDKSDLYKYPSKIKRIMIIALYLVLFIVLNVVLVAFLLSDQCFLYEKCNGQEKTIQMVDGIVTLFAYLIIIFMGWRGTLFGARRIPKVTV